MAAAEFAAGLRELADWIDQHEETLTPSDLGGATLLICRVDKDEFLEAIEALGVEDAEVTTDNSFLNVTRKFGPIAVQVYISSSKVGDETTRLRETSEWEPHEDVRAALDQHLAVATRGHSMRMQLPDDEPPDDYLTGRAPHVMDARGENDRSL